MNKPTIEKIDFGEYEDEVKRIWNGEAPPSYGNKYWTAGTIKSRYGKINKLLGYGNNKVGFCCICGTNLNTHIMKIKVDGAILITRYCEQHLPNES